MENFDIAVIGAGPGGYPAAIRAAQLGASVAIVEKERLGGTCLNWGCIPTKTLLATAGTFAQITHAQAFGITVTGASVDYAAMIGYKDKVVGQLRNGIQQLLAANGVKLFTGAASFKDRNTISIGDSTAISASKVIIATGSTSAMPAFLPKHDRVVESRRFLELTHLPKTLLVLGGGFIGCELACMAAMLGVKVTLVELLEDILLLVDADVRRVLAQTAFTRTAPGRVRAELQLPFPLDELPESWIEVVQDKLWPVRSAQGHRIRRALRWADAALRAERAPAGLAPHSAHQDWTALAATAWDRCRRDWEAAGDADRADQAARRQAAPPPPVDGPAYLAETLGR